MVIVYWVIENIQNEQMLLSEILRVIKF